MHDGPKEHKSFDDGIRRHERYRVGHQDSSRQDAIVVSCRCYASTRLNSSLQLVESKADVSSRPLESPCIAAKRDLLKEGKK